MIDEERDMILGPNKQKITAALIYRMLVNEGFKISESTIRKKFREYKKKRPECFIKQHHEYGERAEYDFHQVKLLVEGEIKIYHMANISLPASNYVFTRLYKNEKTESFIDSLVEFFEHCDGTCKELVFDNTSNVVKRFLYGGKKQLTEDIIKLSNYYGFKVVLTNAYSANEKGHVENSGKTIRRELFSIRYEFASEEDLFAYFEKALVERNKPYFEAFEIEKQHMRPIPPHPYEIGRIQTTKVNFYSVVSIDANFYSVPDKYVGETVNTIIYVDLIRIYDAKMNLITTHKKKTVGKSIR